MGYVRSLPRVCCVAGAASRRGLDLAAFANEEVQLLRRSGAGTRIAGNGRDMEGEAG